MRKLMLAVTLLVLAALGWGSYWYVGASALDRGFADWLGTRRASGWVAEAATLETRGFPNRFDTTFEDLELGDPGTRVGWSAPMFQLLQLSYKPGHVIAIWPGTQRIALPDQQIELVSEALRGSFEVGADLALPVRAVTIEARTALFSSSHGWQTALHAGQLSMRESPAPIAAHSYDFYLDASDITPPADMLARLGAAVRLPDAIAHVRLAGSVAFDKRWDRSAVEHARPQPRQIRVDDAVLRWGDLALHASGALDIGADGLPSGELAVQATNWRAIVAVLEASGRIEAAQVATLTQGLELLAMLSGDPETLDVPLGFSRGLINIGPVPIAQAPKIALP